MNKLLLILLIILLPTASSAESIAGKWKMVKAVPYAETNNKEATEMLKEYIGSFLEYEYEIYMQFSENGKYTEYFLDHQIDSEYTIESNKLEISNSNSTRKPSYSIKNDTLLLDYNHTKNFDSERLRVIDVPDYESVKIRKAGQYLYLKKLPDNYAITDSIHKKMLEQSIIIESKNPYNVKEDILGEWKHIKTAPIIVTNSRYISDYLKQIIKIALKEDPPKAAIVFDKDSIYEDYEEKPYLIDGDRIKFGDKKANIFAINDSILTIDEDLREALIWIGIGVSDDPVSVGKFAVRKYYKRYKKAVAENPHYKYSAEDLWGIFHSNMQYPPQALKDKIEGTPIILFTVHEDGSLSDFEIHQSIHPDIDAEAIRLIKLTSGSWIPKKENGVPVAEITGLGILFELPQNK